MIIKFTLFFFQSSNYICTFNVLISKIIVEKFDTHFLSVNYFVKRIFRIILKMYCVIVKI